nr:unnamed protein product [Digitaria exilis]
MRRGLRRGLGILLVPTPNAPSRPPPISLEALLLQPRRLYGFSRRSLCSFTSGGRAVEQFSDDEYDHEYEDLRPSSSVVNIDEWRWKLSMLQRNAEEQEIISRDRRDRRDYDQIANLAKRMGLYSEMYGRVIVASKVPLPNYRPDLDDKRPQREVVIPLSLQLRVEGLVQEHLDRALLSLDRNGGNTESCSEVGKKADNVNMDEQHDSLLDRSVMEKILQRKSIRMRNFQRSWQACMFHMHNNSVFLLGSDRESPEGVKMLEFRKSLPAYKDKERLLAAIARNQVGYKVRLEGIKGKDTHLLFCTSGILLRRLLSDRNLNGVTHVFVDEIHERGMNEDFLLIVLKDLLSRRRDLRLILMSATLNAELFSSYFGGAPTIHIPDALKNSSFETYGSRTRDSLANWNPDCIGFNLIEAVLCHICRKERPGAVLVFMTGWDDISCLKDQLKAHPLLGDPNRVLLLACHGSMATAEQRLIFEKPPPNVRKVVLATNMAEASITINDIVFVVDCGKAKETTYDALNNTPCLLPSWISKASARQPNLKILSPFVTSRIGGAELAVFNLENAIISILDIKSLQVGSIGEFLSAALQPPEPLAVQNAVEFLKMIGALDGNENLTDLGRYLSMLPVDPKLGKMLIMGAVFRCIDPLNPFYFVLPLQHRENSMSFKTMDDGQVLLYANSVNAKYQTIPYPWLVFGEKVKVNAVFIRDSTGVSDSILILFGGAVTKGSMGGHLKMLDGYVDFFMDPSLSECYLQLKEELDKLIQQKLEDPNFDIHKEGKYILYAAQELAAGDLCEGRFVFGRETSRARLRSPEEEDGKSSLIKDGMNPKSLLQTLLMRAGHTPPKYKTKHLKTNEFRAMVEFKGMQFVGKPKRNKQLAERDAAIEALGWLTQTSGVKQQDQGDDDSPLDLTDSMLKLLTRPRRHSKNNQKKR